jgi:peptide/nickel transport system substrate-binding protein
MNRTGRPAAHRHWAILTLIALALTACSSGGEDTKEASTTSTTESLPTVDASGVIRVGYDLVQEGGNNVFGDPAAAKVNADGDDALYYLVFGRFMKSKGDGTLEPDLAERATIIDANTIEIVLRSGLQFSDGTPFDAAAVKAGLDRSLAAHNDVPFKSAFFSLKSVEAVSPTTVRLSIPDGTAAGWYDTYIPTWPTSIVKPGETNFDAPSGAGPMTVVRYDRGQKLVLKKNPNYWNAKNVKVAGYEFTHVAAGEPQAGIAAIRSGQLDVVTTEASQLGALTGKLGTFKNVSDQNLWMMMCKSEGPLANAKVRIAINKTIDRVAINEVIFGNTAAPSTALWPKGHKFNDPTLNDFLAYDPAGAKKLLKEAGHEKGVSVDVYPVAFPGISDTLEVMQQSMAAVGITLNIKRGGNFVNDFLLPNKPGMGIYAGNSHGIEKLDDWVGTSLGNVCNYDDPKLTALREQLAKVSASDPKAVELWHQAQKIVLRQALGGFVLFRSQLAAYDTGRLGAMSALQQGGQFITPDPTTTYVKAS